MNTSMMDQKKQILCNIYDTLVQIRYPNITTATVENIEITILEGVNRISLLSWLLTEMDEKIATELHKLKGPDLEAKLVQYYSKIGLCNNKDVLLGNCTLEKQLPTLNLLLEFIKTMLVESSNDDDVKVKSIDDILQVLNNDSSDAKLSVTDPKLDYSKSLKYFDDIQKVLDEHQNISSHSEDDKEQSMEEIELSLEEEEEGISEDDRDAMLTSEKKKFLEAFPPDFLPLTKAKSINTLYSMDSDIKDLYTNFSSLTEFLRARDEISNVTIPDGIKKMTTPLTKVIEDILISTEAIMNMHNNS